MTLTYKGKDVNFRDSYLLIKGKLKNLCRDFESSTSKGNFPHDFVTKDLLEYVGEKPSFVLFKDITLDEYNLIPNPYNLKEECLKYLKADCVSLYQVLNKFQTEFIELTQIDPLASKTTASLANKV
jgi:hypothetical protein